MIIAFIIISFIYISLIVSFIVGYNKVELFEGKSETTKTTFSIIIPFRNEAENLQKLLQSILEIEYPTNLFEIILVDDESVDESVNVIRDFIKTKSLNGNSSQIDISIIKNERYSNSPKKDAITSAIKRAKYNWIITTDADCVLQKQWLWTFDAFIQEKAPNMIIAPVNYYTNNTFLDDFQLLDFWSLQAATIGGFGIGKPFMCNGANLAYKKESFLELNGFKSNNHIASGDDLFLMEKLVRKDSKSVYYLKSKNSIVLTQPQQSWTDLFNQRLRWAAKASAYNNGFSKLVGFIVLLMNASIVIMLTLFVINTLGGYYLLLFFFIKLSVDYLVIYKSSLFFNQKQNLKNYFLSSLLYPFFSVVIVVYSIFFKYKWKGRTFKQ